jgi:molecular chaperone HscB
MNELRKNHFEWFGMPVAFQVDVGSLDAAYRRVQATVHPDRFVGASDSERRVALQLATQVNEAYRILRDPARRAAYLCELGGVDPGIERNTAMPTAFLMTQMQAREALDDARASRDLPALKALRAQLHADQANLLQSLGEAIDARADLAAAASLVRQLMFLDKLAAEIDGAEDRLIDG